MSDLTLAEMGGYAKRFAFTVTIRFTMCQISDIGHSEFTRKSFQQNREAVQVCDLTLPKHYNSGPPFVPLTLQSCD